jgi:hypothetical protein
MKPDRNARAEALRGRIGIDANAAVEALTTIAECLEAGELPPKALASYLASGIRRAMAEPSADRARLLAVELGLGAISRGGRPPKPVDHLKVKAIVEQAIAEDGDVSETKLKKIVGKEFRISGTTALKHVRPAMLIPTLLHRNRITSLVRPRNPAGVSSTE